MSSADPREPTARRWKESWPARYGFAVVLVAIATALQFGLRWLGPFHTAYILFYPAIVVIAMWAGFWPGIVGTLLATVSGSYFFLEPRNSFAVRTPEDLLGPILFSVIGVFLTLLTCSRTEASEALKESESDLKRAQAVAHIGSWRIDIAKNAMTLSDETCRIMGLPPGEPVSVERTISILHPDDRERVLRAWSAALETGSYEGEDRVLVQGKTRWVSIQAKVERDREGRAQAALGTVQDITERKQAERSLRLFRALVDQSNDAVEVLDAETLRFLDVNEKACTVLGYTREELLSMTAFDINLSLDKAPHEKALKNAREAGYAILQLVHRRKDGSTFPVEVSLRCVQMERRYIIAVCRDISERKQAEDALRESEDRYRDLIEHSEDLVCTHDLQGSLISVNPAPAHILGYEVAELLKIPMRELVVPELREQFDAYLMRIKTTGADKGLLTVLTRTGERRVWKYSNTLRTEGVPAPIVRGIAHDVTESKRAATALRASEAHFRILVEQASDGIFICDEQGKYLDANSFGAEMLGYTREEILRRSIADIVATEEHPRIAEELASLLGGATIRNEWKFQRKDGSFFPGEVCAKRLPDGRLQGILRDMTERKQAEEILQQSEERFRVALKDSPTMVFSQDRDLRYIWTYNPHVSWQKETVGKTDEEIIGAERARALVDLKRRVLETGAGLREEVVIPHNGTKYSFDLTIEPLLDSDRNVIGITGASMDIARSRELADRLHATKEKLAQEKLYLESEIETELGFEEIIGQSSSLRDVLQKARVVAPTDSTVLLLGETGTGKELVARSVHMLSPRRDQSFIKLNCAAVPSGLLESELFGHEKGAFTGAVNQKVGRLELADKGTLFLDEVGELPLELQPKLLRVLQDREFERLGGIKTVQVDVRIISATNRELQKDVAEKKFREDLFYRLNVFPLQLPPLRDRRSDIPVLVHHFVRKHAGRMGRQIELIPNDTMRVLQNWNWPGNIRELENMIERMVILSKGPTLASPPAELDVPQGLAEDNLTEMEREHIIRVLRETHGVLSGPEGAAFRLGIKRTTLQSMLKRFAIEVEEFRRGTGTFGPD